MFLGGRWREALGEWGVECHAQEHAIMTQPGLDARPLDKSKIENRRLKKVELFFSMTLPSLPKEQWREKGKNKAVVF